DVIMPLMRDVGVATAIACRLEAPDVRLVLREARSLQRLSEERKWISSSLMRIAQRLLYRRASAVIANSDGTKESMLAQRILCDGGIATIYNPIVHRKLFAQMAEAPSHPWLSDPDRKVVLGVGRLQKVKGFDTLIKALSIARSADP